MRKFKLFSRTLALVLSLCMLLSLVPLAASAYTSETHTVFSRTTSTIAPGVTQDICYAYANDGNQMVYYVATADITRDDVDVYANYKDNQCTEFGMQKLRDQMAAAQAKHSNPDDPDNYIENYNVVAGTNADFYNMTTGRPSGAFVMEGTVVNTANNRPFFAILKDGTPVIGANNTDWNTYVDEDGNSTVAEAVGGSVVLVKDGVDVSASAGGDYNTTRHSRTCVGVTAEGKVVMMVLDGRQAPFSCGGTMKELAQIMLEAGCVAAINLDGGGSTTFAAKQEGADEVTVVNRPSDGSERSVSSSLMIVSTAVPSDVFDRAVLDAETDYVTPGATVNVTATGVSPAGTSAEIPADVTWQLEDSSLGTVENGVFTSNGTTGDAVVQMIYNGEVVGETTIKVVIPDTITFDSTQITVPYGKTVTLSMTAKYGLNEVTLKDDDMSFTFSDEKMGTVKGVSFTACAEDTGITAGTITATLKAETSVTCEAAVVFGKGSEVYYDFEDTDISQFAFKTGYPQYGPAGSKKDENGNYYYNGQNEVGEMKIVTAEDGQVKNGEKALALTCDYTQIYETGYHQLALSGLNMSLDASAQAFGFWVYLPELEEVAALKSRFVGASEGSTSNDVASYFIEEGKALTLEHDGWYYFSTDVSEFGACTIKTLQIYITDRDNTTNNYAFADNASVNSKFTLYVDDITVDYSSAVDDREAPVFDYVRASYGSLSDAVDLKGQTIDSNVVSVTAKVADDTTKINYTGLDISTAKAYIDGIELTSGVTCSTDGIITIEDITLADGVHTFKFEICDNMGNKSYIKRNINIAAGSDIPNVTFVPQDADAEKVLIGSVQWFDLVASNIDSVESITTTINLNSVSTWELDNMVVASGFDVSYTIDEVTNNATITIAREEDAAAVYSLGDTVVASLPVRTWVSRLTEYEGYEASTPAALWSRKIIWPMDIKISVVSGAVTYADGTTGSFSSDNYVVSTELYGNYAELNANGDYSNKTSWHVHSAEAMEDLAATCTEDGYTGRTFCADCNSVVDFGTTIPATGHTYVLTDDLMSCEDCTIGANGYVDGKYYINGVAAIGWQTIGDETFYFTNDSVPTTGSVMIDGVICTFDENGVYQEDYMYSGMFTNEDGTYYIINNEKMAGWREIDGYNYYFDTETFLMATGEKKIDYVTYQFEEDGKHIVGTFVETSGGTCYYFAGRPLASRWIDIDGVRYRADENGYICKGISPVHIATGVQGFEWHKFDETTGAWIEAMNGFFEYDGYTYYAVDGKAASGRTELNGEYYHFRSVPYPGRMVTNQYYMGYFYGADGTMPDNEFAEFNGNTYYFVDGDIYCGGLTQVGDDIYYFSTSSGLMKYGKYYVTVTNGLVPTTGYYYFDDNGCLAKDGYYTIGGEELYFVNYEISTPPTEPEPVDTGLVTVDGKYYYADAEGNYMTGAVEVTVTNDLLPEGTYYFAEDGHMLDNEVAAPEGTYYYYSLGQVSGGGLMLVNGSYYYVSTSTQKVVVDRTYWVTATNDLLPAGLYEFGSDGKMLNAPDAPDPTATGLVLVDGKYYYADAEGNYMTGEVNVAVTNDLLPAGIYYFAEDGHMLDDEVAAPTGTYYYFAQGKISGGGLMLVNGSYYYVSTSTQKVVVDRTYWVTATNDLLPAGPYEFGSDGKMLNAPDAPDPTATGLVLVDGKYYYADAEGNYMTGEVNVTVTNDLLPAGIYYFAEDGHMLDNEVAAPAGTYYYFVQGKISGAGLMLVNGDYYYVSTSTQKVVVDRTYWVTLTNDLLPAGEYEFGADGKMLNAPAN